MTGNIYTVGQINSYIGNMFAQDFALRRVQIRGEISNCKYHSSGHIYFSLKDPTGVIRAVMFARERSRGLGFPMKNGDRVIVRGSIRVYEKNGTYQLYASEITPEGRGVLYQKFEELKERLEEMGMFAEEYKQKIPEYPKKIGVVTAPTGAAVRDIQNISHRRNPYVQLILYPALVQGKGAAESIIRGIHALEEYGVDVMIVGRGGGSIEDLWAFNEESVARAVFDCSVPVISAVGHETDVTITDYVADLRAPTPSAAAELAVYDIREVQQQIAHSRMLLQRNMQTRLQAVRSAVRQYQLQFQIRSPQHVLLSRRQELQDDADALTDILKNRIQDLQYQLALKASRLEAYSPLRKLGGGYAYLKNEKGRGIRDIGEVREGQEVTAVLKNGSFRAQVLSVDQKASIPFSDAGIHMKDSSVRTADENGAKADE